MELSVTSYIELDKQSCLIPHPYSQIPRKEWKPHFLAWGYRLTGATGWHTTPGLCPGFQHGM